MSSGNRYVVVPTVTVLAMMKARLTGAVKGHALLKKKADALTLRRGALLPWCLFAVSERREVCGCAVHWTDGQGRSTARSWCPGLTSRNACGARVLVAHGCSREWGQTRACAGTQFHVARRSDTNSAGRGGRRFRQILKKIVHTKQEMGKTMRAGAFALTEAKYAAGEFNHTVLDSVEAVRPGAACCGRGGAGAALSGSPAAPVCGSGARGRPVRSL